MNGLNRGALPTNQQVYVLLYTQDIIIILEDGIMKGVFNVNGKSYSNLFA